MPDTRASLPWPRRLAWAALSTLLVLAAVEGASALAERTVLSPARSQPLPAPTADAPALAQRHRAERQARGLEIPLVPDDVAGWGLPPSQLHTQGDVVVRTNSLGMRGPEPSPPAPGERRILAMGDSSIFGYGVPERAVFVSVAAERLQQEAQGPVTGWIGAVPGHTAAQSGETLARLAPRVGPRWVVIGNLWSDLYGQAAPAASWEETRHRLHTLASYRLLQRLLAPALRPRKVRFLTGVDDLGQPGGARPPRADLRLYADALRGMAATSRQAGADPVYLVLPAPLDFDRAPVPEVVAQYRLAMCMVAAEVEAPCIDGPAVFREAGAGSAWFLDQVHPAAVGHQLLGEALAEVLRGEG